MLQIDLTFNNWLKLRTEKTSKLIISPVRGESICNHKIPLTKGNNIEVDSIVPVYNLVPIGDMTSWQFREFLSNDINHIISDPSCEISSATLGKVAWANVSHHYLKRKSLSFSDHTRLLKCSRTGDHICWDVNNHNSGTFGSHVYSKHQIFKGMEILLNGRKVMPDPITLENFWFLFVLYWPISGVSVTLKTCHCDNQTIDPGRVWHSEQHG